MIDPRKAAPTTTWVNGQAGGIAGRHTRRDQADQPDDRRHQIEARRELGGVLIDGVALAVDPRSWP